MIQKKVLFATDFSTADSRAFQVACQFAEAWKARLLIVHVAKDSKATLNPTELDSKHRLFELRPENLAIDYEHILRHGEPGTEILDIERNRNVVMIILGTHGRSGLKRAFMGSVAERVIREADCPVMTLRESHAKHFHNKELTRILLPIDFSVFGYAALDFATSLAKSLDAELTILHVDDSPDSRQVGKGGPDWSKHESELWDRLKKYEPNDPIVKYHHKLLVGAAGEQISAYANSRHFDFVVLGTHGRSGIGRAVLGSIAEQVVRNTDCPIITAKPSNKRTPILS